MTIKKTKPKLVPTKKNLPDWGGENCERNRKGRGKSLVIKSIGEQMAEKKLEINHEVI